jgi:hypothetical protein
MVDDDRIVEFPKSEISDEEKARRLAVEVDRLAAQPIVEWRFAVKHRALQFGVTPEFLRELVEAKLKEAEKAEAKKRKEDERREKQRTSVEREETRKREKDQARIDKESARKSKEKAKAFADIIKLPSDRHEAELSKLAKRLGEDLAALRYEFSEYCSAEAPSSGSSATSEEDDLEPWPEPITTAVLLDELITRINTHVRMKPHEALATALWVLMSWVHEQAAHYSVYLVATSPDISMGKTTLIIEMVGRLTLKARAYGSNPTLPLSFALLIVKSRRCCSTTSIRFS